MHGSTDQNRSTRCIHSRSKGASNAKMKYTDKIIDNHSMVDKTDPASIQKIFRELMKLRNNVEEFKDIVSVQFQEQASRMEILEDFYVRVRHFPPSGLH
jgi:hypothetical protein